MSRSFGGTSFTTRSPIRDLARRDFLEARDHAQQGGLAAARGADERDEFSVEDLDIDAVNDLGRSVGLADILDADARHAAPSPDAPAPEILRCGSRF